MFTVETLGQFWKLGSKVKRASVPVLNNSSTVSSHVKRPVPRKACGDVSRHRLKLYNYNHCKIASELHYRLPAQVRPGIRKVI